VEDGGKKENVQDAKSSGEQRMACFQRVGGGRGVTEFKEY